MCFPSGLDISVGCWVCMYAYRYFGDGMVIVGMGGVLVSFFRGHCSFIYFFPFGLFFFFFFFFFLEGGRCGEVGAGLWRSRMIGLGYDLCLPLDTSLRVDDYLDPTYGTCSGKHRTAERMYNHTGSPIRCTCAPLWLPGPGRVPLCPRALLSAATPHSRVSTPPRRAQSGSRSTYIDR